MALLRRTTPTPAESVRGSARHQGRPVGVALHQIPQILSDAPHLLDRCREERASRQRVLDWRRPRMHHDRRSVGKL